MCDLELSMRMNEPIRKCYQNEKKCDAEVRTLITESASLLELNQQWKTKIESFDQALRELGDVQAYTYAIERETRILLNVHFLMNHFSHCCANLIGKNQLRGLTLN